MIQAKLSNLVFKIITEFNTLSSKRRKTDTGDAYLMCGDVAGTIIASAIPFFNKIKDSFEEQCEKGIKIGKLNGCIPVYINHSLPSNRLCIRIENFNGEIDKDLNLEEYKDIWQA